jgi:hypothetical protein
VILAAGIAAALHVASSSAPARREASVAAAQTTPRKLPQHGASNAAGAGGADRAAGRAFEKRTLTAPDFAPATLTTLQGRVVAPSSTRLTDYQAYMSVRVRDLDDLSKRTAEAMRLARNLGGYAASVRYESPTGRPGTAELVLRIPVGRVQVALERLSALGTVVSQQVSVRDLQRVANREAQRIADLRVLAAKLRAQLTDPSLAPETRVRLQLQLAEAQRELKAATTQHAGTLRTAALSRVSLELTTQKAIAPAKKHAAGRFDRAARGALHLVAVTAAVALYLLIVLAPLLLLAALGAAAVRAWRRRERERLLAGT